MEAPCDHHPDDSGVCVFCGEILGYCGGGPRQREAQHGAAQPAVDLAELPAVLAEHYNRIFSQISHVERNGTKLSTFYALYHAYMENGSPQPPELIIRMVGLSKKEARKTFTIFAESKTGYRPPDIGLKPRHYVAPYFELLGLSGDDLRSCENACAGLEDLRPGLMAEHPPQKICAAVLFHYCRSLAHPAALASPKGFNEAAFGEAVGISLGALKGLAKKLAGSLPPVVSAEVAECPGN